MRTALAAALVACAVLGGGWVRPADAQTQGQPSLAVSPSEVKLGERALVRLEGWASAAITLSICGNLGLRGAPDCDLAGAQGIGLSRSGPTLAEVTATAPPTTCPCVVRAASSTSSEIQTAPLGIDGVPVGPVVRPGPPAPLLAVSATVSQVPQGFGGALRSLLGGRSPHRVTITLRNTSTITLSKVSLGLAVGRAAAGAQPVPVPLVDPLRPGEARTYEVPATIAAPARGRYLWDVTVDGAGSRVGAQVASTAAPWLLYLLLVVLVLDVAAYVLVKRRRRRTVPRPPIRGKRTPG